MTGHRDYIAVEACRIGWERQPGWLVRWRGSLIVTLHSLGDGRVCNSGLDALPWSSVHYTWNSLQSALDAIAAEAAARSADG